MRLISRSVQRWVIWFFAGLLLVITAATVSAQPPRLPASVGHESFVSVTSSSTEFATSHLEANFYQ
jgi:hypothetical protein